MGYPKKEKKKAERRKQWLAAPEVEPELMFGKGCDILGDPLHVCARCGYSHWNGHSVTGTIMQMKFLENNGVMCYRCHVHGDTCKTDGCDDVAIIDGLCRDCWFDEDAPIGDMLDEIVWRKSSSYIAPEDVAPAMPSGAFCLEMRESAKKMFKNGFWQRRKFGSMGVERWEKRK